MKKYKRRNYLINKSVQLRYMAMVGILMVLISIATGWSIYYTTWTLLLDRLEGIVTLDKLIIDLNRIILTKIIFLVPVSICLGGLITMFIVHRIVGPLFRVDRTMHQIAGGIIPRPIKFRSGDELKDLAESVNAAAGKIGEVSEKNKTTIEKASGHAERAMEFLKSSESDGKAREELEHLKKSLEEFETFQKEESDKRKNPGGMTLMELLVGVVVIIFLIALTGFQVTGLIQRAKVSAARTTMTGLALCLGMIKDDTGLYPEKLDDINSAEPPDTDGAKFSARDWCGPYGQTLSLTDPWGKEYLYELSEYPVFGPDTFERTTGEKYEGEFDFSATPGPGTLIIENPGGVTSGSIILNKDTENEEEVVSEDEFKKGDLKIIKEVTLLASNTITITLASKPGITITISITISKTTKDATFRLRSCGRDGDKNTSDDIIYGTS